MIWLLFYIVPILLVAISVYLDMKKGQTVKSYIEEGDDRSIYIMTFIPVINIIISFFAIFSIVYSLTKNIKK